MRCFLLALLYSVMAVGQVGIYQPSPDPAAMIDVNAQRGLSTFGGMTLPTVTESQRNSINVSPASEGTMVIVQYADKRCLEIYDGQQGLWQSINCLTTPSKLYFSEYVEADNNNKFLELYNPTATPIDLADYRIIIFRNGGDFPIDGTDRQVTLSGIIPANSTFVLASSLQTFVASGIDLVIPGSNFDFGGDDPVLLVDASNTIIDVIGIPGTDPGTGYAVDGVITENATIRRKPSISVPNATWTPTEWTAFPNNDVSGLGTR